MKREDYKKQNDQFLAEKAQEQGVKAIGGGVFAREIKKGNGLQPRRNSIVTVHYTGRLINGKQFDSSKGGCPPAFRLSDLIVGWQIALTQMKVGAKWEIYVPYNQGYGSRTVGRIPAFSTLVFEIELIGCA